ncbi:MAG: NAD-dependent epimerase/dehydratase family protein [Bacteroidota bacterium]
MKILITGGAGFIASHVADAYIAAGHDVVIIDNLVTGNKQNLNPKAKFIEMDIRSEELKKIFSSEKFDVVNHHAAQMDVRKSVEDPMYDASVNILGVLNLLENCRSHKIKKFIFSSTGGAIYGEQDYFPADEEHPTRPLSPYGISKLTTEKYLFYYSAIHGVQYVILRYANVYGPRQNPHGEAGVVAIFATKMFAGTQPVINGEGKQTRDYVYVGDVVRANVSALKLNKNDCINIGTGIETDVNALFNILSKYTGKNVKEVHGAAKEGEQLRSVLLNNKAKQILNWSPEVSLEDGLRMTVDYFRNRKQS